MPYDASAVPERYVDYARINQARATASTASRSVAASGGRHSPDYERIAAAAAASKAQLRPPSTHQQAGSAGQRPRAYSDIPQASRSVG